MYFFINFEQTYDIFGIVFIILFIRFKRNRDYIIEFSKFRNLTQVSIYQRRIFENGIYNRNLSEISNEDSESPVRRKNKKGFFKKLLKNHKNS